MMDRRRAVVLLSVLGVLAVGAVAVGMGLARGGAESWERACVTSAQLVVECAPGQRPEARSVTGELLDGGTYDVTRDRGKVVVVNFWGSWCAPCRAEVDDLEATYQATKGAGVAFIGVNVRDERDAAKAFELKRVTYPSIFDPAGKVALAFDVTQVTTPSTLVLDRQGRIAAAVRSAVTEAQLRPVVERIAAEPPTPAAGGTN